MGLEAGRRKKDSRTCPSPSPPHLGGLKGKKQTEPEVSLGLGTHMGHGRSRTLLGPPRDGWKVEIKWSNDHSPSTVVSPMLANIKYMNLLLSHCVKSLTVSDCTMDVPLDVQ